MSNDHLMVRMGRSRRNPVDPLCMQEWETNAEVIEKTKIQPRTVKLKTNEAKNGVYSKIKNIRRRVYSKMLKHENAERLSKMYQIQVERYIARFEPAL